jgi:putative hydrolase of the HAD superfamily
MAPGFGADAPTHSMTFRGVIFDLFHTLTAAESEWSDLPWTSDALGIDRRVWNDALTLQSRWRLTGEVRDGIEIVRRLAGDIDPAIPEEIIVRAAAFRQERFHRALVNIPPANLRVISALRDRGLSLGLCSNADASEVAAWPASPLCGLFDAEIFSCQVGAVKPEAAIYSKCLEQLGLAGRECVFVGDGGSNELVGAREAGLYSVFFSGVMEALWPERIPALLESADVHIRTLPELLVLPGLRQG